MTMRSGAVSLPLSMMALAVDLCWAIEPSWGRRAKAILDGIDYGAHLVEHSRQSGGLTPLPRVPQITLGASGGAIQEPMADPEDGDGDDTVDDDDRNRREFDSAPDKHEKQKRYRVRDRVATLHLTGPMTKRPQSWGGGCATVLVRRALRQAASDSEVGAICLVIDSPGGQVAGTADLAADIAEASRRKPVMAYAEDLCCSAAYWAGCQAEAGFYCNSTATVGSIGTLMVLEDTSDAAQKAGVAVHVVATGDRKGIGAAGAPIASEHLEYLRAYLERVNAEFTGTVMSARKLAPNLAAEVFRAGIYVGAEACRMGLCDAVMSRDEVHRMLAEKAGSRGSLGSYATNGTDRTVKTDKTEKTEGRVSAGTGERKMRDVLIRALKAFGLHRMAVAVVSSAEDSAEALASAMSEQVNAEVEERIDRHEVVKACNVAGIHTAADLGKVMDAAALGNQWLEELRADAKGQAIRAFGYEEGMRVGAQVSLMPLSAVRQLRDSWSAQADVQFKIREASAHSAGGAQRVSAAGPLHESVTATGQAEAMAAGAGSAWDRLKPDHQQYALQLIGADATAQQKEAFAVQALKDLGLN